LNIVDTSNGASATVPVSLTLIGGVIE
jgi:hypothetical protein